VRRVSPRGLKLGILISTRPGTAGFVHGLRLAEAALSEGLEVYLYCIDDAVHGVSDAGLQTLRARGLRLFACAYGAQRRGIPRTDLATFAGLTLLNDLIGGTDRFVSFNSAAAAPAP